MTIGYELLHFIRALAMLYSIPCSPGRIVQSGPQVALYSVLCRIKSLLETKTAGGERGRNGRSRADGVADTPE